MPTEKKKADLDKSEIELTLTIEDCTSLQIELDHFLGETFSQYIKYQLNENICKLEDVTKPYNKTKDDFFKELSEVGEDGRIILPLTKKNKNGVWEKNPNHERYVKEMDTLKDEKKTVVLKTIPSYLLKKLTGSNNYRLIYRYLIREEEEPKEKN